MTSLWAEAHPEARRHRGKLLDGDVSVDVLVIGRRHGGQCCAPTCWAGPGARARWSRQSLVGSGVTQNTTAKVTAQHKPRVRPADQGARRRERAAVLRGEPGRRGGAAAAERRLPLRFRGEDRLRVRRGFDGGPGTRASPPTSSWASRIHVLPCAPVPIANNRGAGDGAPGAVQPLKLLYGLAPSVDVYENAFVSEVVGTTARTQGGSITAEHIVVFATHYPLVNMPGDSIS